MGDLLSGQRALKLSMKSIPMVFLLYGNSYVDQDLFFRTGFLTHSAAYVSRGDLLLVNEMERSRAEEESSVESVVTLEEMGCEDGAGGKGRRRSLVLCVAELLEDLGVEEVSVPPNMSAFIYRGLSEFLEVEVEGDLLLEERRRKSPKQIDAVRRAVSAAEAAIKRAATVVGNSSPNGETLTYRGELLTSEVLRREMEHALVDRGCEAEDVIAASGRGSHRPHWRGAGPVKTSGSLVLDVFPRLRDERYCGDVTRTLVLGDNPRAEEMLDAVIYALETAEEVSAPGSECSEVHRVAEEALELRGFETGDGEGFVHSVGHGVGLDVHEPPRLSSSSDEVLEIGDVFTIEPGLYFRDVGGVRVEDTFAVTSGGCERLSAMEREL